MKRRAHLAGLLAAPLVWLVGIYIFSLAMLLVTAFWTTDPFTSKVTPGFTLRNFEQLLINYANEKLQQHFNQHVFKWEQVRRSGPLTAGYTLTCMLFRYHTCLATSFVLFVTPR